MPVINLTDREIRRNLRSVAHAIGQQELEGLQVPQSIVAELRRAAHGEVDTEQIVRKLYRRFENVQVFRP